LWQLPIYIESQGIGKTEFSSPAEQPAAADCLQLTLRFSFRQRLSGSVRPPYKRVP
jgi:hypothetical protein